MTSEPRYHFDADTQREILHDPAEAEVWVEALREQGFSGDPMRVVWLRILGRLDEAADLGWEVLARVGGPANVHDDPTAQFPLTCVTAATRLAHVLQWQEEFDVAHELFECALEAVEQVRPCEEDTAYADFLKPFIYQHWARCYYDQHDFAQALALSQRALDLRLEAGVPEDQVNSSTALIESASARLTASNSELVG